MNGLRQSWLVAGREMRERSRSRAFRASLLLMVLVVVAVIIVPALLDSSEERRDVGLTGSSRSICRRAIVDQGDAVDVPYACSATTTSP